MVELTKRAAEAFKQVVEGPDGAAKKVRVTFDTGG